MDSCTMKRSVSASLSAKLCGAIQKVNESKKSSHYHMYSHVLFAWRPAETNTNTRLAAPGR